MAELMNLLDGEETQAKDRLTKWIIGFQRFAIVNFSLECAIHEDLTYCWE